MLAGPAKTFPAGPEVKPSLRPLLESLIDYAGLFPPASLPIEQAVANYARYREGQYAFALGRFVAPAEKLGDVPIEFPVTVLATPEDFPDADVVEVKAATPADVEKIAANCGDRTVFVEITDVTLIDAIRRRGLRAKIRTGGTTAEAFPTTEDVALFIRTCVDHRVAFKATAGLHHPIRTAAMHGFLNVFFAAALPQYADKILSEQNARAFAFDDAGLWWHDLRVTTAEVRRVRQDVFLSFGSCSFEEPIEDLRELGWL
jgi:hypothetical protein